MHENPPEPFDAAFLHKLLIEGGKELPLTGEEQAALENFSPRQDNNFLPGEIIYRNGPYILECHNQDLPLEIIRLQRRSSMAALNLYMPVGKLIQFQHRFFHGCYPDSPEIVEGVHNIKFPHWDKSGRTPKPEYLSFIMDHPERATRDRQLYTTTELVYAIEQTERLPEVALAVIAYFSSLQAYISELQQHMAPHSSVRQQAVLAHLHQSMSGGIDNGIDNILPAIFMSMKNAGHAEPTGDDFDRGFKFANENGAFLNHVRRPNGTDELAKFQCPAQQMLTLSVRSNPDAKAGEEVSRPPLTAGLLNRIYTDLRARQDASDPVLQQQLDHIRTMAGDTMSYRNTRPGLAKSGYERLDM